MKKQVIITFIFCIYNLNILHAQWTSKDSVWLNNIKTGKEQIKLNPETMKAIQEGTLIRSDAPLPELLAAPPVLPISMDFDLQPVDTAFRKDINPDSVPPAVYSLYRHELAEDTLKRLMTGAFRMPSLKDTSRIHFKGTPLSAVIKADYAYDPAVKDGQKRGGFILGAGIRFSLNDILMGIFNKTERAKRRNKKNANAWKIYQDYPEHLEWEHEEEEH